VGIRDDSARSLRDEEGSSGASGSRGRVGKSLMLLLIAGIVAVGLGANSWKRDLPVVAVRVGGNAIVSSAEILRLAAIPPRAKLFAVDLAAVQKRVLQNPFIRSVSVNRQGPEGVRLTVTERRPVALLAAAQLLSVDEEGTVLPAVRSDQLFDLPVLTGAIPPAECVPGKRITGYAVHEALGALAVARRMDDDLFRRISEIAVSETGDLVMHTAEAGVPVILGRNDMPMKLVTFDGFWRQIVERRGPKYLQLVDLRFEDQVVARWSDGPARQ
jgi:cell division protein FtsQ